MNLVIGEEYEVRYDSDTDWLVKTFACSYKGKHYFEHDAIRLIAFTHIREKRKPDIGTPCVFSKYPITSKTKTVVLGTLQAIIEGKYYTNGAGYGYCMHLTDYITIKVSEWS